MKKIALLFSVFAMLLAFVYLYEIRGVEDREKAEQLEKSLLRLSQDEITSFDLERPGKPLIRIVHEAGGWRIQQPVQSSVDQFVVDAFLRDVSQAQRVRSLEEVSDHLAEYGLADPRLTITIRSGPSTSRKILIGNDDFSGNQVYASLDDEKDVFITGKAIFTSSDKDLREWRSKTVLDFDQDQVAQIEVHQPSETIRLNKQGDDWKLVKPIEDRASDSEVSSLLSAVKYARIEDFVDDPGADKEYGLDHPAYRFQVRKADSDAWQTLEVGKQKGTEEAYFARDTSRPLIFTLRKTVVDKLSGDPSLYRDHKVVDLEQDGFDELNYTHQDVHFKLAREGSRFTLVEPEPLKGREVPTYKFWYPIQDLEFKTIAKEISVETDPRFAHPNLTLEFKVGDQVRLYEFVDTKKEIWGRQASTGRAGTVAREDFEKILFKPDQLANPPSEEK